MCSLTYTASPENGSKLLPNLCKVAYNW